MHDRSDASPGTVAGQYLRRFWQPIAAATLKPGEARPVEIMHDKFTLYRGESGAFHLTDFHCAHRRAQLSVGWIEGEAIRCRYHGWKYDEAGQCVEQPAEGEQAFCDRVRLRSFPLRIYKGLVFAYLSDGAPPAFPEYPPLEGDGPLEVVAYRRGCNYLNNLDNNLDTVHVHFVHHFQRTPPAMEIDVTEKPWGATSRVQMQGENFLRVSHFVMPNLLLVRLPMIDMFPGGEFTEGYAETALWRVPLDHNTHETFGIMRVVLPPDDLQRYKQAAAARKATPPAPLSELTARILKGEASLEAVEAAFPAHHEYFKPILEDCVIQQGQGVVQAERERLAPSDVGTAIIRRLWRGELQSMAAGGSIREWQVPSTLAEA